jgi:hypothetical protein
MIINFNIKDIRGVADNICYAAYILVFARFALHNQEELRGLRHAFQKEKWITIGGEHYQLKKETQLWPNHQIVKGKGIRLLTLTAYLPQEGDNLYFVHDADKAVAQQFEAFLYQHTPYPVPPLHGGAVENTLRAHGSKMPVEGGEKIAVYRFADEKIIEILEELT